MNEQEGNPVEAGASLGVQLTRTFKGSCGQGAFHEILGKGIQQREPQVKLIRLNVTKLLFFFFEILFVGEERSNADGWMEEKDREREIKVVVLTQYLIDFAYTRELVPRCTCVLILDSI